MAVVAEREGAVLRHARPDDLPAIDALHILDRFRVDGLRFAHVDTGLDDAHLRARRAYEAVGFDRAVPGVEYWQNLDARNPGSFGSDGR